ncbi:MAG TPA: hypothetical protein VEP73_08865 [Actinomycetota bacterium]|nr:hypothetical protein [Actinomycetota bacterium]
MTAWNEISWDEAMRRAQTALLASEELYDEIDAQEGRSNVDIEKHLRRAEVKASHARSWVAIAQALGTQHDRYGSAGG